MKKKKDKVGKAIKTIRDYCAKMPFCKSCRFSGIDGGCLIMSEFPPCDWDMNKLGRQPDTEAGA